MHWVHTIFDALQPIAILESLNRDVNIALAHEKIIAREQRRRLRAK